MPRDQSSVPTRALSVRAPWAGLIVAGAKRIENRTWRTRHRGPIWIHESGRDGRGLLGIATVVDVLPVDEARRRVPGQHRYTEGPWCWVLADPVPLPTPIPCPGALSLWTVPPERLPARPPRPG